MAVLPRVTTDHPPSAAHLRTAVVLVPCVIGLLAVLALLCLAFYYWVHQDDKQTFEEIENHLRRRRSSTVTSRLSALDASTLRGALHKAVRSTGPIMSPKPRPPPIAEETDTELARMHTVDLTTDEGGRGRRSSLFSGRPRRGSAWSARTEDDGGSLFRYTTWGSIVAPSHWVRRWDSRKRREGG